MAKPTYLSSSGRGRGLRLPTLKTIRRFVHKSFTAHQWRLLFALGTVNLVAGLIDSMQAPTYDPNWVAIPEPISNHTTHRHHHHHHHHHPKHSDPPDPELHNNTNDSGTVVIHLDINHGGLIFPFWIHRMLGLSEDELDEEFSTGDEVQGSNATLKNGTEAPSGLFIGGFDIAQLLVSPGIGMAIHFLGPKNTFLAGICTGASSTAIFGMVKKIQESTLKNILAFISRTIVGIGTSATFIAIYTLLTMEFPRTVALAFAIISTLNVVGKAVGPSVGNIMFQIAGTTLPFIALGMTHYALAYFTYRMLPKSAVIDDSAAKLDEEKPENESSINNDDKTKSGPKEDEGKLKNEKTASTDSSVDKPHVYQKPTAPKTGIMNRIFSTLKLTPAGKPGHTDLAPSSKSTPPAPAPTTKTKLGKLQRIIKALTSVKSLFSGGDGDLASKRGIRGYISLMKIPAVLMYAIGVIAAALVSGFVGSILQPHLLEFKTSTVETSSIGKIFFMFASASSVFSIVWGALVGHVKRPEYVALLGTIIMLISILPIGPIPYILNTQPDTAWSVASLVLTGLGLGAINVAAFVLSLDEAKNRGFPEDGGTAGLIASIFVSSVAIGGFLGPSAAKFLYSHVGFRNASLFVLIISAALVVAFALFLCYKTPLPPREDPEIDEDDEESPLLASAERIKTAKYYYHVS